MAKTRKRPDSALALEDDASQSGFVLGPRAETKQRLLAATLQYLEGHGVADLTLRQLAKELGTSHRLLIYHFGDKEGVLIAVVKEIERQQKEWVLSLRERHMTPMELLQQFWLRTCDPKLDRQLRLFVEIYGHTLHGRAHTASLLDTLVHAWIEPSSNVFRRMGMTPAKARMHARLQLATARGLMLDLLTTGDVKATSAAWAHYMSQFDNLPGAHEAG